MLNETKLGRVVTFYSYKGGAGRSMALANVAALLGKWGKRVLVIDWHLEAPGLEQYLEPEPHDNRTPLARARRRTPGVVDLIDAFARAQPIAWRDCVLRPTVSPGWGQLAMLSAGRDDTGYGDKLRSIDWDALLRERELGGYIATLRAQWTAAYDFVLIDAPAGSADRGDICTVLLPDVLVALFASSELSLSGGAREIERARKAHAQLMPDRAPLQVVPVMAKDASLTEHERSIQFRERVALLASDLCKTWLDESVPVAEALSRLKLPYAPAWSFGERLPVVMESTSDPTSLAYAYETLARLLERDLNWERVADAEAKAREADERRREAQASLDSTREKMRRAVKVGGAALFFGCALLLGIGLWRAREMQRARLDTLVAAVRSEDDPGKAALLWNELALSDPKRSLSDALGTEGGLAWPIRAFQADPSVKSLALGPGASTLAWSSSDGAFVRRFAKEERVDALSRNDEAETTLRISKDGRLVLATHADRPPWLWNLASSSPESLPTLPPRVAFSRDETGLIAIAPDLSDATFFRLRPAASDKPSQRVALRLPAGISRPRLRALGADGASFLGDASADGHYVLLSGLLLDDSLDKQTLRALEPDCAVQGATVFGAMAAYQCALRNVVTLQTADNTRTRPQIRAPSEHAGDLRSTSFSADGSTLITTWDEGVSLACEVRGTRCAVLRERDPIVDAQLAPDGLTAVTRTRTGTVRIWRLGLGAAAPRDWEGLRAALRRDGDACLAPNDRSLLLGEDAAHARTRYVRCELARGRMPRLGDVSTHERLPSLLPTEPDVLAASLSANATDTTPGLIRVTARLIVDSESAQMVFPLAVSGEDNAPASQDRFSVVAGEGSIAAYAGSGVFLQQPLGTTALVGSAGSQFVASRRSLSSGQKVPLPWIVVDAQRARGGAPWQVARPFLQMVRDFRWDLVSASHIATFAIGLDFEGGRQARLSQPIHVRFATPCTASPAELVLDEPGPDSLQTLTVTCSKAVKNQRATPTLGLRVSNGALDYPFTIPRRPGAFELHSSNDDVLGLGLGALQLTVVQTEEDRTPLPASQDLHVPLIVDAGKLEPSQLIIPAGQVSVTTAVRPRGAALMHVRAGLSGTESSPIAIGRSEPWFFIGLTVFGGAAGGYAAERRPTLWRKRRRSVRTLLRRLVEGSVLGLTLTGASLALASGPADLHHSELVWVFAAALLGFVGTELVELGGTWLRKGGAPGDQAA